MYNVSLKKCLFPNNLIETMWQDDTDYLLFLIIVEVKYFSAYTTFNHIIVRSLIRAFDYWNVTGRSFAVFYEL